MPDTVYLPDRLEVTRAIPAPAAAIFDIVRSPAGHVAIDGKRLRGSATEPYRVSRRLLIWRGWSHDANATLPP